MSGIRIGEVHSNIPLGMTAWEAHTRALAARAIRLQVEKEARQAEVRLTEEELQRRCAIKAADVSPFLGLVKARPKKQGVLARLIAFW
ncbi:hypothetical protein [Mesorhizobium sp. M0037]|uniref:hypothetical protein n=1 Tax=unclassified Mesorhizobium TaxID=325217 RepID=UPI0033369557